VHRPERAFYDADRGGPHPGGGDVIEALRRFPTERVLSRLTPPALALALFLGLVLAPPDALQGQSQRLMYLHVPAAMLAYLFLGVGVLAGLGYLARRDLRFDRAARAAIEVGVVMTALTLIEGSIWGRPTWGVYWTWDPRLVATALLLLIYVGYLALRCLSENPHRTARRAAIFALVGFVDVPFDHFATVWFRSIHQPPTIVFESSAMLAALGVSTVAFLLLAGWIFTRRLRVLNERAALPAGPAHAGRLGPVGEPAPAQLAPAPLTAAPLVAPPLAGTPRIPR
jgi:heme exporter protein C